jgi:hypothetical protein
MLFIAILSTVLWSDGWKTVLTDEPCLNENHAAYLRMESKSPALAAWNKLGKRTLEACYIQERKLLMVVDDESVRIKAILDDQDFN